MYASQGRSFYDVKICLDCMIFALSEPTALEIKQPRDESPFKTDHKDNSKSPDENKYNTSVKERESPSSMYKNGGFFETIGFDYRDKGTFKKDQELLVPTLRKFSDRGGTLTSKAF